MVRRAIAFVVVVVLMAALAAAAGAQVTLNALGVPVSLNDRLVSAGRDIIGLGPTLVLFLAPFALMFFLLAGLAVRFALVRRIALFAGAGALTMLAVLAALDIAFDVPVLAAARTSSGVALLAAAGALGGMAYAWLGPRSKVTG